MDWNVGINKMQIRGSYLMPQVTSAASPASQTNVLMQNFCNSGNSQTTNIPSSMKYILTNKKQFQHNRTSKTLRPVFPKVAGSETSFGLNNTFYNLSPSSLSTMTVQMAADVQNPNVSRNMHISSSIALEGNPVNSMPNMHQKTNAYMVLGNFSNKPLQNYSNSMGTSVYQQASLNTSSPKKPPTPMSYYYMNGPATSQTDARVSLNSASNYYLAPQQNFHSTDYSSAKNCPNPATPVAMQSHTYASDQINPPQYPIYSHYDYRNAVQATNINLSLSDLVVPIQANHGQFVVQQPTTKLSNENVESYHNSLIDQNSNLYSLRPDQKSQSLLSCTETNVEDPNAYNVSGIKTTMQLSNESMKSFVEAEGNLSNSVPPATTVKVAEPSQQTNRTLQLEKSVSNENLSKDKCKITRESLSLDVQALYEMRNALLKLKENFSLKKNIYLSSLKNAQTCNTSVNNQNSNNLIPCNTNSSVKCTVQQVPADKVTPNQFSSKSHNSSVIPQKTKNHLLPILWNMLQGTGDENMLFNADVEDGDKYQNKHFTVQENSCTDFNDDAFRNPVNTDGTTKLSYKISPVGSTQGTSIIKPAHNQLEKIPAAPNSNLLNSSEQNKDSGSGVVQYLNDSIHSLVQNSDVSQGSSSMKNSTKEHGNSATACRIQHSENTCLQKPANSEKLADASSSSFSKGIEAITRTHGIERTCSLEELKTGLALWRKCLPKSLNEIINRNTLASSDGIDGQGTTKSLEKLPNSLTQNYDTKVTVERTQIYGSSSFEKNLDGINSNLSKGSEPQVAVVTPRVLSKNNDLQKNIEIIYPAVGEDSIHCLEKLLSTKPDSNNEEKRTIFSPAVSYKHCEDLNVHQGTNKSAGNNKIVKAEVETNHSLDFSQEKANFSPLGLKQYTLDSIDQRRCEMITNHLTASQKCVASKKHGPNLNESNNTAEVGLKDSMLQISSVCTLVQGDAFYNSQIADIFSTSSLKSDIKFGNSEEHMPSLQHNEEESSLLKNDPEVCMSLSEKGSIFLPSGSLSKTFAGKLEGFQTLESPQCGKTSLETNESNSEKQKNNDFLEVASLSGKKIKQDITYGCNTDLTNNEVFENQEGLCEANSMSSIRKGSDSEHILDEGKKGHLGSSTESSEMFLNDQLTELSKEFPYGIGYLNMAKGMESKDSITTLTEREDKENTMSHEKNPDPSDAIDQIKIVILNSEQMSEVFPEGSPQSSNKLDNHGGDRMGMNSKGIGRYRKSNQDLNVDSKIVRSERPGRTERTYCCLPGWLASRYNVEPCSCMLAKEPSLKSKTDLYSQSKEASKSNESDCSLKNEVQNSILDADKNVFHLGDQGNKASGCKETEPQVEENKLPKLEQATCLRSLLEKPNSQEPKKRGIELSHSADSQSLQKKRAGTNKIHNQINGRRSISKSEAQYHLNTDFKKIIKKLTKKKLEKKSFNKTLKSKTDIDRHKVIETKHGTNFEKYKIKRDTCETHMIKGPVSSKSLKRQMMKGKKHKALETQPSEVTPSSTLSSVSFTSQKHENSKYNSTSNSQEHLIKTKLQDLEKHYGYKKVQHNESICSKQRIEQNHTQIVKRINLEKYAYRKDNKNTWKSQSSHFNTRIPASQNKGSNPSNVLEIHSPVKEGSLDNSRRDKRSVKSPTDKKSFKRKNKLSLFLQKEQKKNYLNRVAFKRIAQKTIHLTSLDSVDYTPIWHVKSSPGTEGSEPHQKGNSSSRMSEAERPQMLEFKMCPEILFRKSTSEVQTLKATNLPEKNRIAVTAVKSKREDWLNYCPVKRRKLEENEIQVNDDIPLDTAIKLLEGNEVFQGSTKDSKATFETYRKMHLEKRSQSLDSTPLS